MLLISLNPIRIEHNISQVFHQIQIGSIRRVLSIATMCLFLLIRKGDYSKMQTAMISKNKNDFIRSFFLTAIS